MQKVESVGANSSMPSATVSQLIRIHTSALADSYNALGGCTGFTDMSFVCRDGQVQAHQCIVASQSAFLRRMMECRQSLEFDVIDWEESAAFLSGRRKSDEEIVLTLPDFDRNSVKMLLSCFYTGQVTVGCKADFVSFKSLVECLAVDTIDISKMEIAEASSKKAEETRKERASPKKSGVASTKVATPGGSCEICNHPVHLDADAARTNQHRYVRHLLVHFKFSHYDELPVLKTYYCPYRGCTGTFANRYQFLYHIGWTHSEFLPRLERRLRETEDATTKRLRDEHELLLAIRSQLELPKLDFDLGNTASTTAAPPCDERDIFRAFEERAPTTTDSPLLRCDLCQARFKCPEHAVTHLCFDHDHDNELLRALKRAVAINDSDDPLTVRPVYRCTECPCLSTMSKSTLVAHLGFRHDVFKAIRAESLIVGLKRERLWRHYNNNNNKRKKLGDDEDDDDDKGTCFEFVACDDAQSVADTESNFQYFECQTCHKLFNLSEAKHHFESNVHKQDNRIRCKVCNQLAVCPSLDRFRSWYNGHECSVGDKKQQQQSSSPKKSRKSVVGDAKMSNGLEKKGREVIAVDIN